MKTVAARMRRKALLSLIVGGIVEKFLSLTKEKQDTIINAALTVFSKSGYKKASVNDIAVAAGISKAMVFYYFGTKKNLYFYLLDLCKNNIINDIENGLKENTADFFDRITLVSKIKISALKEHPGMLSFFKNVYLEMDKEVERDIQKFLSQNISVQFIYDGIDYSKFKDGIEPKLVLKMLIWITEGYINELPKGAEIDIEKLMKEFNDCLNLIKNNFYKKEYV